MAALSALIFLLGASSCSAFAIGSPAAAVVAQRSWPAFLPSCGSMPQSLVMKEKKDVLELEGVVLESLKGANFRVQLDDTEQVAVAATLQ